MGLEQKFPQLLGLFTLFWLYKVGWLEKLGQKAREEDGVCLSRDRKVPPEGHLQAGLFARARRLSVGVGRGRWMKRKGTAVVGWPGLPGLSRPQPDHTALHARVPLSVNKFQLLLQCRMSHIPYI